MARSTLQIEFGTPKDTCCFARVLGGQLSPGDTILLNGSVGAGKTYFARSLIQSKLEVPEDVPSPTFTLVQVYDTSLGEIWHADLYRLTGNFEVEELGLDQAFSEAICLVEWPDRLGERTPKNALTLTLDAPFGDDRRVATFTWQHPSWDEKLKKVMND